MRFLKSAILVAALLAGAASTSIVASAYPTPHKHHSLHCSPSKVSYQNGSCTLTFRDGDRTDKPRAGQMVCFTVLASDEGQHRPGPGTVSPPCSFTDSSGRATATYSAGTSVHCNDAKQDTRGGKDRDGRFAHIRATESGVLLDEGGSAQTAVKVACPERGGPRSVSAPLAIGATVPSVFELAYGVLGITAILTLAIVGRLRLRSLRRR